VTARNAASVKLTGEVRKPRLLDLFCGAGGAAMGYHRAGFDMVGVDIEPQPHYPFPFWQADALEFLADLTGHFDAVHASPPCQRYIRSGNVDREKHPDLLGPTRELLIRTGLPWVLENVPGAPMEAHALLCGSMFGLAVKRHRWFEANIPLLPWTPPCRHDEPITGVYGHAHGKNGAAKGMLPSDLATWSREMGIDWMTAEEIVDAIPPAYTEWIGAQFLEAVTCDRR
jgi:DNA (cytosine-5)-methyltransferase 1